MIRKKDYFDDIVVYIKRNLKKGYTKESLKWALINQGYSKQTIEKAFGCADLELAQEAPELKTKPQITYEIIEPKEFATKVILNKKPLWKKLLGVFRK